MLIHHLMVISQEQFLVLGEGPTDDVKGSLGVTKKKFSINYSNAKTKF